MNELTLAQPIPSDSIDQLASLLAYCDPALEDFDLSRATEGRIGFVAAQGADIGTLVSKIQRVAHRIAAGGRVPPSKILHRFGGRTPEYLLEVEQALSDAGWVREMTRGVYAISGPAAKLLRLFDEDFRQLALQLGALEAKYPTLLPVTFLNRINYFRSFPHYITLATHLRPDIDLIEGFMERMQEKPLAVDLSAGDTESAQVILSPAICYHLYCSLLDSTVPDSGLLITAEGNCCRWESSNLAHLRRLWEFSMRELIIVGPKEHVLAMRDAALRQTLEYGATLGLVGWVENANDPFFAPDAAAKSAYQRGYGMKWELRLPFDRDNRSLAAASFNNMQTALCESCNIRLPNGEHAFSGCVGWGLDRWVFAFVAQHGLDTTAWPESIRTRLS